MSDNLLEYIKYTIAVEGQEISDGAMKCCERILDGNMTADDAMEEIKRMYGVE